MSQKPATPNTYVRVAQRLLARVPGGQVSAGQVAYHAHRRSRRASKFDLAADSALCASGLFRRASFVGTGRFPEITLWSAHATQESAPRGSARTSS